MPPDLTPCLPDKQTPPYKPAKNKVPGLNELLGTNYDFVKNPDDMVANKYIAAMSGAWDWRFGVQPADGDLNKIMDRAGNPDNNFMQATKGINGHSQKPAAVNERQKRLNYWNAINKETIQNQNAYGNMQSMLSALGFGVSNQKDYNTKFGIELSKRQAVEIEPSKRLEAEFIGGEATLNPASLEKIQADFGVQPGEVDMLVLDQNIQDEYQSPPVVMLAEAKSRPSGSVPKIGICVISPTYEQIQASYNKQGRSINPGSDAEDHFVPSDNPHMFGMTAEFMEGVDGEINSTVKVLEAPKHGKLETYRGEEGEVDFRKSVSYVPNPGYVGKDRITVLVTGNKGRSIVLSYYINVTPAEARKDLYESGAYKKYCPNGQLIWKISLPTTPVEPSDLQSLLSFTGISGSVSVEVADLPGTAVAQTTGEGTDASITFDPTAAGHNWFIDQTPGVNEEFLPTSNPNQWIAKADSEAAGKMDLLSVLLHEYGHVLGIEHSADGNDFMAATLQPGVRRLPSSDELSLMAQLASQARLALDGSGSPDAPNPALPLGTLGFALLGRLRRTDYGAWTMEAQSAQLLPQSQIAINPTLQNGGLADTTAWQTSGNIALDGNGSAVLGESATAQAHLAQGFVINPGDRTLSFTVKNDLQTNGSSGWGPQDAFEVALLNANTGEALTGTDGLSMSDALLNIQTNGTEHTASSVHKVQNADGSTTYHVDLPKSLASGAATGTPALLSFDLIGFGGQQSHVTLRDIRLSRDPIALDDSLTTDEDTPVTLTPLTNDIP